MARRPLGEESQLCRVSVIWCAVASMGGAWPSEARVGGAASIWGKAALPLFNQEVYLGHGT